MSRSPSVLMILAVSSLLVGSFIAACSGDETSSPNVDVGPDANVEDGGQPFDEGPSHASDDAGVDASTDSGVDAHREPTLGDVCTALDDCVLDDGSIRYKCESGGNPTAACTVSCTGDLTKCDDGRGICDETGGGYCRPTCEVSTTAITKPCQGKNHCYPIDLDANGKLTGLCRGGCTSDADCDGNELCEVSNKICTRIAQTPQWPKGIGEACTRDLEDCYNCMQHDNGEPGYCVAVCVVGATNACPSGMTCAVSAKPELFDGNPPGVLGSCVKNCTTIAECPATTNWSCTTLGGTTQKGCIVDR